MNDDLYDANLEQIVINYYLTSIYDHSVFEAFSKVIQKITPQLPTLENLLNALCSNSAIEKAYLFDSTSKVYIATDSSPVDVQSYELCSDMMDVMMDMTSIYGNNLYTSNNSNNSNQVDDSCVIKMSNGLCLYYRKLTP